MTLDELGQAYRATRLRERELEVERKALRARLDEVEQELRKLFHVRRHARDDVALSLVPEDGDGA